MLLASEASSFMTGAIIPVNGDAVAWWIYSFAAKHAENAEEQKKIEGYLAT